MANLYGLTETEVKVVERLCEGDGDKEIAHKLDISISKAKVHVKNILLKMKAKNRTQAALIATGHRHIVLNDDHANAYIDSLKRENEDLKAFISGIAKNALQAVGG